MTTADRLSKHARNGVLGGSWGVLTLLLAFVVSFEVWAPLRELARIENISDVQAEAVVDEVQEQLADAERAVDEIRTAAAGNDQEQLDSALDAADAAVSEAQGAAAVFEPEFGDGPSESADSIDSFVGTNPGDQEGAAAPTTAPTTTVVETITSTGSDTTATTVGRGASVLTLSRGQADDRFVSPAVGFRFFFLWWSFPDADELLFVFVAASGAMGASIRVILANTAGGARWALTGGHDDQAEPLTEIRLTLYSMVLPFLAAILAVVVLYLLRAGFLGVPSEGSELDQYALGGLSALVGLGTEEMLVRLKAVLEALLTGSAGR